MTTTRSDALSPRLFPVRDARPLGQPDEDLAVDGIVLTRGTGGADLVPRRFSINLDWGPRAVVTFHEAAGGRICRRPTGA